MTIIVGSAYRELKSFIESYAKADHSVLCRGITGSGKELVVQHFTELSKGKKIRECATRR
jgi:transcriptional regulator with PAS, ATPase and Fis domain